LADYVVVSLRKVLFGGRAVETVKPGLTSAGGAGTFAPGSPGASSTLGGAAPVTPTTPATSAS